MSSSSFDPLRHTQHWLRQRAAAPGRGPWRAVALTLSGGSLLASAASRRSLAAAASSGAANTAERSSLLERFPWKAAFTAGGLALTGDTIAQVIERRKRRKALAEQQVAAGSADSTTSQGPQAGPLQQHDWVRALRMASYGFLLYGPLSQLWYQLLEKRLPGTAAKNLALKVVANQVILGPCVLMVVMTWNFGWMKRIHELPGKIQRDFVPSLVDGWIFWIPASTINFGFIPLHLRVAYMSTCAIFWNFYLSTMVGKDIPKEKRKA